MSQQLKIEEMLALYGITNSDIQAVREFGKIILPKLDQLIVSFYEWLKTQPEFTQFITSEKNLNRLQEMQKEYWQKFFVAVIDEGYVDTRHVVGETHARIGLALHTYFSSMNRFLVIITEDLYDNSLGPVQYTRCVQAVTKLVHLDTAIVVETFSANTNRIIAEQQNTLMEMSTPVTAIWKDILLLPIVGIIDSSRAQNIMTSMLTKISETQAKTMILDISGVVVMDTAVANHLIKVTKATKLMGCECTISGVSPAIAQTIVELGIDVGEIVTNATLKDALATAFEKNGIILKQKEA